MKQLEETWNSKFNYPWTFFNDVPFTEEFKEQTQALTKAKCSYHVIPKEHWEMPSWVSEELYQESAKILKENDVQYAGLKSYHQMCRWNSGMFYRHPALEHTQYYWRVEPKVKFFCHVDYDVFRYMQDHNKTYGFNINLFDSPESIPSLWPETIKFLASHSEYLHKNNAMAWLVDNNRRPDNNIKAHGYSTCHFWSNFEIADLSFWRSQAYEDYFTHLDRTGGFFYERWGDAPVHSIALGLFEDASKIHWYAAHGPGSRCNTETNEEQVQGYRIQPCPILQLPELTEMFGMHARAILQRRTVATARRLQAALVQVCGNGLKKRGIQDFWIGLHTI
jgi:mannosyltransferase